MQPNPTTQRFTLRLSEVSEMTGLSTSTILEYVRDDAVDFPRPINTTISTRAWLWSYNELVRYSDPRGVAAGLYPQFTPALVGADPSDDCPPHGIERPELRSVTA